MGTPVKHTDMRLDYYEPAPRNEEMEISIEEAIAELEAHGGEDRVGEIGLAPGSESVIVCGREHSGAHAP